MRGAVIADAGDPLAIELQRELAPGERLLWSGAPERGLRLERGDLFAVPFSLLWGGFAIFWFLSAIASPAPAGFSLFGLPFVVIGLYMIAGRFVVDAARRSRTRYALTTERAMILERLFGRRLVSLELDQLGSIELIGGRDGPGTLRLTPDRMPIGGLLPRSWPGRGRGDAFEAIPDAATVFAQIRDLQRARRGSR